MKTMAPRLLWTYAIHDGVDMFPAAAVFVHREDAIMAAENEWSDGYETRVLGRFRDRPPISWARASTDPDQTFAEPWDGITIRVYPVRIESEGS